jgi:cell division protein FtsW (lipid II flippase)
MKRTVWLWQLFGFAFTALLGTLLHFLYDWLGEAVWIAPFSGVNEATWEHMKLLFWPAFIFAVIQSFFFRDREDFWCVKAKGIILGIILIPLLFYTYNGVVGKSPDWINIAIFFICAAIVFIYESRRFNSDIMFCRSPKKALIALLFIAALFVIFTFLSPKLGIFKDPVTGAYGI